MLRLVVTTLALGTVLNVVAISQADARRHRHTDANGNTAVIVSHLTGAKARVGAKYAAKFQAYVDDLEENHGAKIFDMGGNRRGHCSSRHMHSCGKALDLCQLRRGVVSPRCRLPDRDIIAVVAAKHGLFEGGLWCDQDYGHAQVGVSAPACGSERIMMAKTKERKVTHVARYRTLKVRTAKARYRGQNYQYQSAYVGPYQQYGAFQDQYRTSKVRRYSTNQIRRSRNVGGQSYYAYYQY